MTRVLACAWVCCLGALMTGMAGCAHNQEEAMMAEKAMAERWPMVIAKRWRVASIGGRTPLKHTSITLEFRRSGDVTGRAGVNRYTAVWERAGLTGLHIGAIAATRMHLDSPRGVMAQEQRFLNTLQAVDAWSYSNDQLTLLTGGKAVITFVRDEPSPSR